MALPAEHSSADKDAATLQAGQSRHRRPRNAPNALWPCRGGLLEACSELQPCCMRWLTATPSMLPSLRPACLSLTAPCSRTSGRLLAHPILSACFAPPCFALCATHGRQHLAASMQVKLASCDREAFPGRSCRASSLGRRASLPAAQERASACAGRQQRRQQRWQAKPGACAHLWRGCSKAREGSPRTGTAMQSPATPTAPCSPSSKGLKVSACCCPAE